MKANYKKNNTLIKRILIAPNSFKECSDSVTISSIIYNNLKKHLDCSLIQKPISDGGDGFTEVCNHYYKGEELFYNVSTPYSDESLECKVVYSKVTKTVYIESANVLGLKVVPSKRRNPLMLSSKGLGELLLALADENFDIKKVIIGIGGTATIDMGLGACSVLGLKLFDLSSNEVPVIPSNFYKVKYIEWNKHRLPFSILSIIDVSNPLVGVNGAAREFGLQKGADEPSLQVIENGLVNILNLLQNKGLIDSSKALSGAGGGIHAGFKIFLDAESISAEKFILEELNAVEEIRKSDLVLTGEGAFDEQSFMGKGAGIILNKASEYEKKMILVCGNIDAKVKSRLNEKVNVFEIAALFDSQDEAIKKFETGLNNICDKIIKLIIEGIL